MPCLDSSTEVRGGPLDAARGMPRVPDQELRERLAARHAGLQPSDDAEADGVFAGFLGAAELAKDRERRPEVGRGDRQSSKAFRHHADNLERHSVHQDHAAENPRIACEVSGPGAMAEDDGLSAGLVVRGCERAPTRGADAEDLEEVPRHERALHPLAINPSVDLRRHRECIGEHACLADERFILGVREALGLRVGRLLTSHREQLVWVAHFVDTKNHGVQEREHDGHQPQAEPHRCHNRQRHQGCASERATGVTDVSHHAVDERRAARVAALVGGDSHRAEACHRARPSLGGAQTVGDMLLCFALDVKREFLIQVALHAVWSQQRARPQFQTAEIHERYASFITRPMAAHIRSHSPVSTASCRRPEGVSS